MDSYLVSLPIIRPNFEKTKAFKFKGKIVFISNKHGVIFNWKISFDYLAIDLYTTPSWFKIKNKNFNRREKLFSLLNLKQEVRPNNTNKRNKIVVLDKHQILKVEKFLNDDNKYNSTIKNIISILKGNNPGGEAKNPSSAEMIINSSDSYKNFVILLDNLTAKHKIDFDVLTMCSKEISIQEFVNLNSTLKSAFEFMQKAKDYTSWIAYLNKIKDYYKKYNIDLTKAQSLATKARSKFAKNVESIIKYPFNFKSTSQFQKCHIYEFHNLRDKIVEALRENKSTKKYENMISDVDNFLPLPEEIHRKFDGNYFTYKPDGFIWPIHKNGKDFIDKYIDQKYYKIPEFFLNENRKNYLSKRNNNINR